MLGHATRTRIPIDQVSIGYH